ncbi:hypothetical protein FCM35_KLT02513 [Carex littledalei]|uniref:Uncharacterized protein n=1 Tax=Carex littledalei TaxID=544730 RepID=A0A833VBU0_9POAL|nr:hypothetical protein FCM35_KLT02513 [Carex littledalei]
MCVLICLQEACTVIAELAANYPVQYLYTIFSKAGSLKYIRVADPNDPNLAGCSTGVLISKEFVQPGRYSEREVLGLHVVVQYDTAEEARKSIYLLNSKALRVRPRSDYCIASECDLDQAENDVKYTNKMGNAHVLMRKGFFNLVMKLFEENKRLRCTEDSENTPQGE